MKCVPILLLTGMAGAVVVAAPGKPPREGLASHEAVGKACVVESIPALDGGPWITARLRVTYAIAGLPGEAYTVELWLGRAGCDREARYHFDTQEVVVPGEPGGRLTVANGKFDRRYHDRDPDFDDSSRRPRPIRPGEFSLPRVELGESWDYRLVVKKNGKVVSDTGYFKAVLTPVVEL
ncbi:MAG: hypothetical protein J2P46_01315 [Zavarzinella sp.]|nr:hypothetical protein [Zavarzinella sp.]